MSDSAYQGLATFVQDEMSMAHIHQPAMLMTLVAQQGSADKESIARAILKYEQSQVDYYKTIVSQRSGRALRSHEIVTGGPRGSGH